MSISVKGWEEAIYNAKTAKDRTLQRIFQHRATEIECLLLEGAFEIEAAESRPTAWAHRNEWDHRTVDPKRWEKKKRTAKH